MLDSSNWLTIIGASIPTTLALAACTSALSLLIALTVVVGRFAPQRAFRVACTVYVDVFRSIPAFALLLLMYTSLGVVWVAYGVSAFWVAVFALAITESAYFAEIFRAAVGSVRSRQWDAAFAIGLSRMETYRLVIFPQALPPAIPPTVNTLIVLFKGTSLASYITVGEITMQANRLVIETFLPLQVYAVLGLVYLAFTVPLGYLGRWAEHHYGSAARERALAFEG